jgi:hypothetical protein
MGSETEGIRKYPAEAPWAAAEAWPLERVASGTAVPAVEHKRVVGHFDLREESRVPMEVSPATFMKVPWITTETVINIECRR